VVMHQAHKYPPPSPPYWASLGVHESKTKERMKGFVNILPWRIRTSQELVLSERLAKRTSFAGELNFLKKNQPT